MAGFDPDSPRWKYAGKAAAEALVVENPLVAGAWVDALRPARKSLLASLQEIFRDRQRGDAERSLAAGILADYAADQPQILADLVMDADEKQFAIIFKKFRDGGKVGLPLLQREIKKPMPEAGDEAREVLAERQANAAVALMKMNVTDSVWPLLKFSPDPRVRSYLIDRFAPLGVDVAALVQRLPDEPDVSSRRALILCLGEFDTTRFPSSGRQPLVAMLLDLYRNNPDPGLHAAAEWFAAKGMGPGRKAGGDRCPVVCGREATSSRQGDGKAAVVREYRAADFRNSSGGEPFRMGSPNEESDRRKNEVLHEQGIG